MLPSRPFDQRYVWLTLLEKDKERSFVLAHAEKMLTDKKIAANVVTDLNDILAKVSFF